MTAESFPNLEGKHLGNWEVLGNVPDQPDQWRCLCEQCKGIRILTTAELQQSEVPECNCRLATATRLQSWASEVSQERQKKATQALPWLPFRVGQKADTPSQNRPATLPPPILKPSAPVPVPDQTPVPSTEALPVSPEYKVWMRLKRQTKKALALAWFDSFESFLADVGERPGSDFHFRLIDSEGAYVPGNCRWEKTERHGTDQSFTLKIEGQEVTRTLTDWAEIVGITEQALKKRLHRYNWTLLDALTTPAMRGDRSSKVTEAETVEIVPEKRLCQQTPDEQDTNLTTRRFGVLRVVDFVGKRDGKPYWRCRCACTRLIYAPADGLLADAIKDCGCITQGTLQVIGNDGTKYRIYHDSTPEYKAWGKARWKVKTFSTPEKPIPFYEPWHEFENFLAALGMKPSSAAQLRLHQEDRGYVPGNTYWKVALPPQEKRKEQKQTNLTHESLERKGRQILLTVAVNGRSITQSIREWSAASGTPPNTIRARLSKGWSAERAVFAPSSMPTVKYRFVDRMGLWRELTAAAWAKEYGLPSDAVTSQVDQGVELAEAIKNARAALPPPTRTRKSNLAVSRYGEQGTAKPLPQPLKVVPSVHFPSQDAI